MGVDRIENAERQRADRVLRLRFCRRLAQCGGDDRIGGGREQRLLVGDVPVDRAAAGRQMRRERAKGQRVFAVPVEDLDRRFDVLI